MVRFFSITLALAILAIGAPLAPASAQHAPAAPVQLAQSNGMTLAQAVQLVRRQTEGRIISAETKVRNGREVHHIKVLTRDGKVKTHRIPGRRRVNR